MNSFVDALCPGPIAPPVLQHLIWHISPGFDNFVDGSE
jgi:hypothetical protein